MYKQPWRLVQNRIRGNGGREIDKFRGIEPPVDDNSGSESWVGSDTRVAIPPEGKPNYGCAEVIRPDGERMFLFEAIAQAPEQMLGSTHLAKNGQSLGVLIKFLDAQFQYSLQCHPTRPCAKALWDSDYGKEESWYVLGTRDDTAEPAYILLGFKEGVTPEAWAEAYRAEDIKKLESMCHKVYIQPGDVFFVGGGVPHAVGEGCFVIEVQEPSDITVSVYTAPVRHRMKGWPEPTEEYIKVYDERFMNAFVFDACSEEENLRRWKIAPSLLRSGDGWREEIMIGPAQTEYFSFTRLTVENGAAPLRNTGFMQVAIVVDGEGTLNYEGGSLPLKKGDELFFPYGLASASVSGSVTVILCHPEGVTY